MYVELKIGPVCQRKRDREAYNQISAIRYFSNTMCIFLANQIERGIPHNNSLALLGHINKQEAFKIYH